MNSDERYKRKQAVITNNRIMLLKTSFCVLFNLNRRFAFLAENQFEKILIKWVFFFSRIVFYKILKQDSSF